MAHNSHQKSSWTFSKGFDFVHLTGSPHYPQENGKVERAVQTIKNFSKKASGPYIAQLNNRSTPLQHGKSPEELFMNRKLRTRTPTISAKHTFRQHNAEKYEIIEAKIKEKQKINFDKRHCTKEHSSFVEKTASLDKDAKTSLAKVVKSLSPRSVLVKTDSGLLRRNKRHLRKRSEQTKFHLIATSQELSTLLNLPREVSEYSHDNSTYGNLAEQVDQPETQLTAQSEVSANPESPQTARYTRKGRKIRPPKNFHNNL